MISAEQLIERRSGLGGSDAAAVVGLSPYRTPLDVYLEKRGLAEPDDLSGSERVHFGNVLEDVVAQEYARRTGRRVRRRNSTFRHRKHPMLLGNVDRTIDGERRVLECKTADKWTSSMWGEAGTDEVPEFYLIQCMHYLEVLDYDVADLAVLIGGNEFRVYTIERNRSAGDALVEQEVEFWTGCVEAGVAPLPTAASDFPKLWPRESLSEVVASEEIAVKCEQLRMMKNGMKVTEKAAEQLELEIKTFLGGAAVLVGADGKPLATWKSAKDSQRLDLDALRAELPDVVSQYTKTVPGSRRFLLK